MGGRRSSLPGLGPEFSKSAAAVLLLLRLALSAGGQPAQAAFEFEAGSAEQLSLGSSLVPASRTPGAMRNPLEVISRAGAGATLTKYLPFGLTSVEVSSAGARVCDGRRGVGLFHSELAFSGYREHETAFGLAGRLTKRVSLGYAVRSYRAKLGGATLVSRIAQAVALKTETARGVDIGFCAFDEPEDGGSGLQTRLVYFKYGTAGKSVFACLNTSGGSGKITGGFELALAQELRFRAGFDCREWVFSVGLGVRKGCLIVDWAARECASLPPTHVFSIGLSSGRGPGSRGGGKTGAGPP